MRHRISLELDKATHNAPIPMGARVGNMIFSSGIMGKDPATGELPSDPRLQAKWCFENMKALLAKGGGAPGDVGHMTVFIPDNSVRQHVNEFWLELYPDPTDRPARHTLVHDLPPGIHVQIEIVAVLANAG